MNHNKQQKNFTIYLFPDVQSRYRPVHKLTAVQLPEVHAIFILWYITVNNLVNLLATKFFSSSSFFSYVNQKFKPHPL